jgi:hypothetical protein
VQVGLALRLEASRALLALGRLDAAEEGFNYLKDWSSEGEVTFAYGAGCVPTSVRQQALRGLAKVRAAFATWVRFSPRSYSVRRLQRAPLPSW